MHNKTSGYIFPELEAIQMERENGRTYRIWSDCMQKGKTIFRKYALP